MAFCLVPEMADKFKEMLKKGEINPDKLYDMPSEERRAFFAEHFGGEETGKSVNSLFESKMLLKDFKAGAVDWAKQVAGMKGQTQRDFISKVEKLDHLLSPEEQKNFLQDYVSSKFKTEVTFEEAQKISELSKKVKAEREALANGTGTIREYGMAKGELFDYMEELAPTKSNFILNVLNMGRSIPVVGDLGWFARQGWGLMSRPELWKGLYQSPGFITDGQKVLDLRADILGDPDYKLVEGKLRLPLIDTKMSQKEPEYMSALAEKTPIIKQMERANNSLATYTRFAVTKKLLAIARANGEDIRRGSKAVDDIIKSVHNFSGSGNIGVDDKLGNITPYLNPVLYSARGISARINIMDPRNYFDPKISQTARQANIRNLLGSLAITLTVLGIAKAAGAEVEVNSLSSNFGKIKIGKLHFDISGGNASYLTFVSRFIQNKTMNGNKIISLDKGYGAEKRSGLALNFGRNKLAPVAAMFTDYMAGPIAYQDTTAGNALLGKRAKGESGPKWLTREIINKETPMISDTFFSLFHDPVGTLIGGTILDGIGIQTTEY